MKDDADAQRAPKGEQALIFNRNNKQGSIERLKDEKIALLEAELMQMKIQARKDKYKMKKQQVESELNMGPQSDVSMQGTSYQDDNSATPQKNMGFTPPATQSTTYSTKTIEPKSKKKIVP